ncbi:hypothetical protein NQ317_003200 [Molorchus minor]|uniref:Uncharacterized protein n=1 Tax=Molorchus minor TaxID=1323400 RepID=A0ABQ9IV08_9CUCU|nr:hypothetical protein NQ317_003200 [Molorchus minor]
MKVALIAGVAEACRGKELKSTTYIGDFFLITVRNTKNKVDRNFVIKNLENSIDIVEIFRKYVAFSKLRPLIQNFCSIH